MLAHVLTRLPGRTAVSAVEVEYASRDSICGSEK